MNKNKLSIFQIVLITLFCTGLAIGGIYFLANSIAEIVVDKMIIKFNEHLNDRLGL